MSDAAARAGALAEVGRHAEALPLLLQALAGAPGDPDLLCEVALCHYRLGQLGEAKSYAEQAIAADPAEEWGHRLLGLVRNAQGDPRGAEAALREARRVAPDNARVLYNLAEVLLERKQLKEATAIAEELRALAPDDTLTHDLFAHLAFRRKDWPAVETHCRRALALNPEDLNAHYRLAVSFEKRRRPLEAIELLHRALATSPFNQVVRLQLFATIDRYLEPPRGLYLLAGLFHPLILVLGLHVFIIRPRRRRDLPPLVLALLKGRQQARSSLSLWQVLFLVTFIVAVLWSGLWAGDGDFAPAGLLGWFFFLGAWAGVGLSLWQMLLWRRTRGKWFQ